MTISRSRLSYTDCYEALDSALEDRVGIRIRCEDYDSALFLRMRMHTARAISRNDNREIYPREDPKHGASEYDVLILRIKKGEDCYWLYIEHTESWKPKIEALSELPKDSPVPTKPPKQDLPKVVITSGFKRRL